jgi:rRNA-processing protein FCF1
VISDPESTIGKAFCLLKSHREYSHVGTVEVPTKTHVALVENFINKIRVDVRAVAAQFHMQYGVKLPLQFIPKMLPNVIAKMNYVSNQGTLDIAAPAIQRDQEPLDYKSLVSLKIGDIVLGYHTGDETRTKAVFIVVLDHTLTREKQTVTSGFNLETDNTSAGNLLVAKFKKVNISDIPSFVIDKLKDLESKAKAEAKAKLQKARKLRRKLMKEVALCSDPDKLETLKLKLRESPPEVAEITELIDESPVVLPYSSPSEHQPSETQGGDVISDVQGGEVESTTQENSEIKSLEPTVEPALEPVVETTSAETTATASPKSTAHIPAAVDNKRYNLRKSKKKLESYLILEDLKQFNDEEKDWNLFVMLNIKHRKGKDLEEFLTLHTTVTEAMREDEQPVKEAICKEWDQVLEPNKPGDKEVLKCMSPDFSTRGKTVLPCMMFMKKKMNKVTKKLEKWKARLAAGGHMQDAEMYPKKDITVPTLDHSALLTFLSSMMKRKSVKFHSMDFPGAYLSADLESEIYMIVNKQNVDILLEQKPELRQFVRSNGTIITKVQKALYGLKEAGKLFRDKLVSLFDDFGLQQINSNKCIFKKELANGKTFYVCVYVDDVIIATDDEETRLAFLKHCEKDFPGISMNSDDAFSFLGMAISFDYKKRIIRYDNSLYIQELAETYEISEDSNTPFNQSFMSNDPEDIHMDNVKRYKSLVMSLFYVAKRTRPDILFAVSYLATKCAEPTESLFEKAKKVLSYLKSTKSLKLTHTCANDGPKKLLFAFVDASYATHEDMKGHSGCLIFDESGNLLFASSTKQKLMSKSSTDAEIIAVHSSMNIIEEMRDLFNDLNNSDEATCLYQDNLSAKFLMEHGDSSSDKSKHMKIRYFYIKEKIDDTIIRIEYRDTKRMWADLLTKPITNKKQFGLCRSILMNCQDGDKYYMI